MTWGTVGLVLLQVEPGIDPNIVKPGWTPLLIVILLALVLVFLYRSMRRQVRRIDVPGPERATTGTAEPAGRTDQVAASDPDPLTTPGSDPPR